MVVFTLIVVIFCLSCFLFRSWLKWELALNLFTVIFGVSFLFFPLRSEEVLSVDFMVDSVSYLLMLLTVFITGLMLTGSYTSVLHPQKGSMSFLMLVMIMMMILCFTFLGGRVIFFFILFESALVPIFLMILGWGYQPERLQASLYMLFYTIFASLPMLFAILFYSESFKFFDGVYIMISWSQVSLVTLILTFLLIFAFLVKLPMFMVHLWLPKAHVEAPVAGSMILAGVLLKLGGYGLWRMSKFIEVNLMVFITSMVALGVVGGVIVSLVCTVQIDMKSLVAYSSVVHMGILLAGMATFNLYGFQGALAMMIGHGAVSSGLFFLVGSLYDRFGSRTIFISKGLTVLFPFMSVMWFILIIQNISAPPSITLLSEILLVVSLMKEVWLIFPFLMMMNFMAMVYSFYLYSYTQHGIPYSSLLGVQLYSVRESVIPLLHLIPVVALVGALPSVFG